jgi:hypothetical protein
MPTIEGFTQWAAVRLGAHFTLGSSRCNLLGKARIFCNQSYVVSGLIPAVSHAVVTERPSWKAPMCFRLTIGL